MAALFELVTALRIEVMFLRRKVAKLEHANARLALRARIAEQG